MGEAKRKRSAAVQTVYHHTSTLRTNLIWMSGVIDLEGRPPEVLHPDLGALRTDAFMRRAMTDFPPLAWFTRRIDVPKCLLNMTIQLVPKDGGAAREIETGLEVTNGITLNRLALGFPITDVPLIPWPQHYGYHTAEGDALNACARDVGDNPNDWYVSETPVDVAKVSEAWGSKSRFKPKLERMDSYARDIRRMVEMCRTTKGLYIPPSWLKHDEAEALARHLGIPVRPIT